MQRLYVDQKLSAAKIAVVYGLRYSSPKTAESTVLYHLKRNGIARRDPAEHVRKVTPSMVDEWVRRYQNGESLKKVAGGKVTPNTVLAHLRERRVEIRDKVEAQIKAVSKFQKVPFSGDRHEMAYIIGLAVGDIWSIRHGRAVRVRLSTTHPSMSRLFRTLFASHGPIYEYPRKSPLTGFEWALDCDLDDTYSFLLEVNRLSTEMIADEDLFFDFLAGFFDAEGTVYLHRKRHADEFELPDSEYKFQFAVSNRSQPLSVWILRKSPENEGKPRRCAQKRCVQFWRTHLANSSLEIR